MTNVGIINVTGYAGVELARLLHQHSGVELVSVTGRSLIRSKLADVFPHLADIDLTIEAELADVDVAFSALPHGSSAEALLPLIKLCQFVAWNPLWPHQVRHSPPCKLGARRFSKMRGVDEIKARILPPVLRGKVARRAGRG